MRTNTVCLIAFTLSIASPFRLAIAKPNTDFFWGADASHLKYDQFMGDTSPRYVVGFKTNASSRFELSYQEPLVELNYKKSFVDYPIDGFVPFITVGFGGGTESFDNITGNIYKLQSYIGADYRLNSLFELTSGLGFGVARLEFQDNIGNEVTDNGLTFQAYAGLRVFPFQ
ncbi:hypothetical protein [Vibrio sp. ES.051]|uniref:hypothetical protein n=1 Tax=Vibrio sp. ES.051 TaxID=1761909 RepID=UPI000BF7BB49|nr:hypothetical protein [Vibrio sp. ES.051]